MSNATDNPKIEVLKAGGSGVFTNYIYKAIPLAFDESMSYYETLAGLRDYLEETVIPTVNNNAEAVAELQGLYEELNKYVDDYFKNLDVQEEINNKLDDLVEDGTLERLIGAYIDPLIEAQNQEINNFKTQVNNQIATQNAQIQAVESGSPLVASSVSGMTDTTRVYVNTTDGNWYYYNGSAWAVGGVYQSTGIVTDKTLNVENEAADALSVGTKIRMFNSLFNNKFQVDSFINGDINQNGTTKSSIYRIVSKFIEYIPSKIEIKIPQGYMLGYHTYGSDGTYIGWQGWSTTRLILSSGIYLKFIIRKATEDTSNTLDIETTLNQFSIFTDKEINLNNLVNYGNIKIVPAQNQKIVFNKSNYNITITLPAQLFIFEKSSNNQDVFTRLSITTNSFIISNNELFVYNIEDEELEVITQSTFLNNQTNYIILFWNHYGNVKGQWEIYYLQQELEDEIELVDNKIDEININEVNTHINFISREGQFTDTPINSIFGAIKSKKYGYKDIRVDVRKTSDNIYVLHHDTTINAEARNTDGSSLTQTVNIADNTYADLNSYDYGIKYGNQYAGLGLTKLEDFMYYASIIGLGVVLELKIDFSNSELDEITNIVSKYGYENDIWYSTVYNNDLNYLAENVPFSNLAFINHFESQNINYLIGLQNQKRKVRIDAFDYDTFEESKVINFIKNGIGIKVGSAYNLQQILNFASKGINYIEVANVENPQKQLIDYVNNNYSI